MVTKTILSSESDYTEWLRRYCQFIYQVADILHIYNFFLYIVYLPKAPSQSFQEMSNANPLKINGFSKLMNCIAICHQL